MAKEIRLNAFNVNGPVHHSPGLWRHPRDRALEYNNYEYWMDLARTLERGKFDSIFFADSIGINDVYGGNARATLKHAAQTPRNDPWALIPAMAVATRNLGFAVTGNTTYEPPFLFARRLATLDLLTRGRMGWNVVTGHYESGARSMGLKTVVRHDQRYDIANEYLDVVYQLWEGSWDDGAVIADRASGVFADPDRIHKVAHHGEFFDVEAILTTPPSPQRSPVIFQAGASSKGREFAARHAEGVFVSGPTPQTLRPQIDDIRRRAALQGRDPAEILVFSMVTVIVGETEAAARAKLEDYRKYVSLEAALVVFSGWTGIDFSGYKRDDPLPYQFKDAAVSSALDAFTRNDPGRTWTVGELAEHISIGGRGPLFVGSPAQVADLIESWVEATDSDGLNLSYAVTPEGYEDFVDLVVPELQKRGRYKHDYAPGVFREKLYGPGRAYVQAPHPAARFRGAQGNVGGNGQESAQGSVAAVPGEVRA